MEGYILTSEAARRAGCCIQTVRNWIAAGILPGKMVVGRLFVPERALERLLK